MRAGEEYFIMHGPPKARLFATVSDCPELVDDQLRWPEVTFTLVPRSSLNPRREEGETVAATIHGIFREDIDHISCCGTGPGDDFQIEGKILIEGTAWQYSASYNTSLRGGQLLIHQLI